MGRNIGARVRKACQIVAEIMPCSARQVLECMTELEDSGCDKYLSRAVGLGLMTVDRSYFPKQYRMVTGWQQKLEAHGGKKRRLPQAPKPSMLDQVWR